MGGAFLLFGAFVASVMISAPALGQEPKLPDGYVGSETCAGCHQDIVDAFPKNAHSVIEKDKKRGWTARACESCHGPGAKHAESAEAGDIRNPTKLAPRDADKGCLNCHINRPTQVGRITSGHGRGDVACVACHTVHKTGEESSAWRFRKASRINQQCASCHTNQWASFQKPHRHPLPEGAMSCVSCHNPHGSFLPAQIRTANANQPGCFKCHSDKRGPFVFEHAPVRLEPCSICHEPHGSANPRMLNRHEVMFTCLECHSNLQSPGPTGTIGGIPPAFHDLRSPRYRNCTICHQKVHGSNASKGLLR